MHPTKNDISPAKRKKITDYLNPLLADAVDLKTQSKQAHWNVRGENFIALHELFDKVVAAADEASDQIAERIVQLGGTALGTARVAAKASRLKEYPLAIEDSQKHVDALSTAIAAFVANVRKGIDDTDDMGDKVTSDLLTGIAGDMDKYLWFVEANAKTSGAQSQRKAG